MNIAAKVSGINGGAHAAVAGSAKASAGASVAGSQRAGTVSRRIAAAVTGSPSAARPRPRRQPGRHRRPARHR
jgi:hypothetical protein